MLQGLISEVHVCCAVSCGFEAQHGVYMYDLPPPVTVSWGVHMIPASGHAKHMLQCMCISMGLLRGVKRASAKRKELLQKEDEASNASLARSNQDGTLSCRRLPQG